jgi:hypothetical protein
MESSTKMYKCMNIRVFCMFCWFFVVFNVLSIIIIIIVIVIAIVIILVVVVVEIRTYIYIYIHTLSLQVVLTSTCPFQLDDKTFKLLTDIFLFYDLSVFGFLQHYKVSILLQNVCGPLCIIKVVD